MTLDGHAQCVEHSLGGVEVGDDPLGDGDWLRRDADRVRVQAEVDDQLFGCTADAAEIGVTGENLRVVHLNLRSGRLHRRCSLAVSGRLLFRALIVDRFGHESLLLVN